MPPDSGLRLVELAPGASTGSALDEVRHLTDLGNAERLVADHGERLRFIPGLGWYTWDSRRWKRDRDGDVVRCMKETVRGLAAEAATVRDDTTRKQLLAHALRSEGRTRIVHAIDLAESDSRIIASVDALDADPWKLNVTNGTIALNVGELLEHERGDLITQLAPVTYSDDATAPRWEHFLDEVFDGDGDLIAFVQRAVGYSLTGSTREQVLFVLYGSGANGKTTFIEVMRALLGDYGKQTPAETFLERRETIPSDLARLRSVRFVAAVETGEGRRLNETLVKRLTGGDSIAARFMYGSWFEFRPAFKAWLATNHKPYVRGTDEAIWRRLRLIPFTRTIPDDTRDPDLGWKLRRELPGILRWAVEGCLDWLDQGLHPPSTVSTATAAYRQEMDVLGGFLDECCVINPDAMATAADLYGRYLDWVEASGERDRLTKKAFGLRLAERDFEQHKDRTTRWWRGLGLLVESGKQ